MKKHKIGIVGLGRGRAFVNVFGAHPDVEITAICDIDENRLKEIGDLFKLPDNKRFTDYDDFINSDFDIVVISTPIPYHTEQTIKALENKKDVLCEQTVAYTIEECEKVLNAVKKSKQIYMMAENYCYFHYIREWKKIVESGKLGEIYYAEGEYIHNIVNLLFDKDKYTWRAYRPPILYCAHTLGPLLMIMNDRIVKGCGLTSGFKKIPECSNLIGFLDIEVGLFKTKKGAIIKILRSQVAARPHMVWYCLYGTKGHLENQRYKGDGLYYVEGEIESSYPCPISDPELEEKEQRGGHGTSEYYMIRDFLYAVENRTRPPIDIIRAIDFTVPGIIAHQSAMKDGIWLDVPLFDW
ncbi:MAG: Gfo/Idh/MocA family oxidoreductase [Candidatus Omnitrophica bacterium]|nr:Gfo/Idh/MocA family oxidoreductase [Candidatus Omnitrophota bacterium]MCM8803167.1 Gfo/Idh/MocA family oxidoreductase [Candidatus Omnitrophota bacterium]